MADMFDSGSYSFNAWSRQIVNPDGTIFFNRWLGEFNPEMTGEEANKRFDHVGKMTLSGQAAFIRGWDSARLKYEKNNLGNNK